MPSYQFNIFKEVDSLNLWFKDTVFSVLCARYPEPSKPLAPAAAVHTMGQGRAGAPGAAAHSAHPRVTGERLPLSFWAAPFTLKPTHTLSTAILFPFPSQPFSIPGVTS